jgi:hypothetical protein
MVRCYVINFWLLKRWDINERTADDGAIPLQLLSHASGVLVVLIFYGVPFSSLSKNNDLLTHHASDVVSIATQLSEPALQT